MAPEAFFLPVADGQRFCIHHPAENPRGALVYVHPFAEEMNKSRRMAALQARLLAKHGYAVLQIDLHGCGDSSGDFGDATWEGWLRDVADAQAWLRARYGAPLWLWGLRAGCLLAVEAAARLDASVGLLFWQPVVSGKQCLQQFLRLKVATEMMSGDSKRIMETLKKQLAASQPSEIAGYTLSPVLARGLEGAELVPPPRSGLIAWLELSTRDEPTLSRASTKCIEQWQAAGHDVQARVVAGPAFWQTTEIEDAPALLAASLTALGTAPP